MTNEPTGWTRLAPLPNPVGLAAPFAGVSGGALLVGGGANFPEKPPWEGGTKRWHDAVFVLERPGSAWKRAGTLPRPLAYGVGVTFQDAMVCVGGSDADRHYAEAFRLVWDGKKLTQTPLPSLPVPLANAAGVLLGETLCVVGGQDNPASTSARAQGFCLNVAEPKSRWEPLPPLPGPGRILSVVAALDGALFVLSGAELVAGPSNTVTRRYLRDAYCLELSKLATGWRRLADLPRASVAAPSPAPTDARRLFLLGGDDGTRVGFTPPDAHPGFATDILAYDPKGDSWSTAGTVAAARVTVPLVHWNERWVLPSGERRPGVRSPEVWAFTLPRTP